jgi:hypothetical protein
MLGWWDLSREEEEEFGLGGAKSYPSGKGWRVINSPVLLQRLEVKSRFCHF